MKLSLADIDAIINVNNLKEVTSPLLISNKMVYEPNGILSNEIFGISKSDRRNTFAYISLQMKFIHPHIYHKVLKSMFAGIVYIVNGKRKYSVKNGQLVQDDNGWTGLANLYVHWDEIDWSAHKTANVDNKKLLTHTKRDDVFIDNILVIPPAYRDVMLSGTVDTSDYVNELNDLYVKLIRNVATLSEGGVFARIQYSTQGRIQDTLVSIYIHAQTQVSKKQGLIRRYLLGKSVDFGSRSVISAPTYNNERFSDNMVSLENSALPISQCCSNFYPFIEAWLKNFFTREIINDPNLIKFYDKDLNKEITAPIKDPEIQFSDKVIRKMINDYMLNPDNRFRVINVEVLVPTANGDRTVNAVMMLKGKIFMENNVEQFLNRPVTLTDILYLACVDVCEHRQRHIMVTRYPIGTDKGLYFCRIKVSSTRKHVKLLFNGVEYPYYPDIDIHTQYEKVGTQFIDTLVMSNSHLDGMGADYDGDQVTVRGIWTDEANIEAEDIMNSKITALTVAGSNSKVVAKEVFNTLYELSKIGPDPKPVPAADVETYLSMDPDDFTLSFLTSMFATTVDCSSGRSTKRHNAKHQTWDTMTVPANHFYKGQPAIKTTIGRFIVNKLIFEAAGIIEAVKYREVIFNSTTIGSIDTLVGHLYLEDRITRQQYNAYTDRRDNLGYWLNAMLAHTISEKMLKPLPQVEKRKAELIKKYENELRSGNIDIMTKISDELVAYAKELLKGDPGMDMYDSGDLNFSNNYKNNSILKGAVINQITKGFDFIGSSFMDGIEKKDIPAHANSILASQYPASVGTQNAGYLGKKLIALLQMMEVSQDIEDCHTKHLIPIIITKKNSKDVLYTYIDDGGELKLLTDANINNYIGKTVMMRSPMSCTTDKICQKCAGDLFRLMGIEHAGLFATQISHADLNLALKAKHNSLVSIYTLDPDRIIEDI